LNDSVYEACDSNRSKSVETPINTQRNENLRLVKSFELVKL
jgi:hypothetical protein